MSALVEVRGLTKHFTPSALWVLTGAEVIKDTPNGRLPSDHYFVSADFELSD